MFIFVMLILIYTWMLARRKIYIDSRYKERLRPLESRDFGIELCRVLNGQQLTVMEEREIVDDNTNFFNHTIERYEGCFVGLFLI